MAREAIRITEAAQDPDSQGHACADLAEVLQMAGRREEAIRAADEAATRFDRKANEPSAARARRLMAEIEAGRQDASRGASDAPAPARQARTSSTKAARPAQR